MDNAEQRQIACYETESNQRQHHECLEHYEKMCVVNEASEYNKFKMLNPSIQKDGDQWCVLYGDNLQVGIAGFGDTPHLAILAWNKEWHNSGN